VSRVGVAEAERAGAAMLEANIDMPMRRAARLHRDVMYGKDGACCAQRTHLAVQNLGVVGSVRAGLRGGAAGLTEAHGGR
jgi:hypothetical protein